MGLRPLGLGFLGCPGPPGAGLANSFPAQMGIREWVWRQEGVELESGATATISCVTLAHRGRALDKLASRLGWGFESECVVDGTKVRTVMVWRHDGAEMWRESYFPSRGGVAGGGLSPLSSFQEGGIG